MAEVFRRAVDLFHRKEVYPYLTGGAAKDDREIAHERVLNLMERLQRSDLTMSTLSQLFVYRDPILSLTLFGKRVPNPLGIAAGFDKDARVYRFLGEALGFGIVKPGSITKLDFGGNPRPRIFDLPQNDGLINRMGFPGGGTDRAEVRLKADRRYREFMLIINIAASKPSFERNTAIEDYGAAYSQMLPYGDAIEVNISSPNTPGVRGLQEPEVFEQLASHIKDIRDGRVYGFRPLIYKFGPDLPAERLEKDLRIAIDNGADGVTLTNTSTNPTLRESLKPDVHKNEIGGMSGALLEPLALDVSHRAYDYIGGQIEIFRAGGIGRSARDIWDALTFGGASAVDAYASFVRETTSSPNYTFYRLRDLARAMRAKGMTSMDDFKVLRGKRVPFPKI